MARSGASFHRHVNGCSGIGHQVSSEQRALQSHAAGEIEQQQEERPLEARPTRTDPGFPGRWGERASTGILNAEGPRLSRTTPDFIGVVRGGRPSKYADTIDAFPMENATTQNVTYEVLPGDLEPPYAPAAPAACEASGAPATPARHRVQRVEPIEPTWPSGVPLQRAPAAAATPPSNETIDELIEGLRLEVQTPRKRRERRGGDGSRSSSELRPHRSPPPSREHALGVGPDAYRPRFEMPSVPNALAGPPRPPRGVTFIPRRFQRHGPFAVVAIALLLTCFVVPFVVVRLSKGEALGESYKAPITTTVALSVAIQPPPAPTGPIVERSMAPVSAALPPASRTLSDVAPTPMPARAAAAVPANTAANKRPVREQAARTEATATARADELESDIGAPTPTPPPNPAPPPRVVSSASSADLLTGH
ncbi:hypothetical protein [Pendulispora albinea]|uniref:Uncharacterized protein n=1 Tax=Pendulispora albinea TaxID=2741071 RepID=A0ABZ2LVX1_9BACT